MCAGTGSRPAFSCVIARTNPSYSVASGDHMVSSVLLCGENRRLRGDNQPRKMSQVVRPTKRPMSHPAMTQRTGSAQQVMHHPQSGGTVPI